MDVFAVHYQYEEWNNTRWKFVGVFSTEDKALEWVNQRFTSITWRKSLAGENIGLHATGRPINSDDPNKFNVMPIEIDVLIARKP